MHIIYTTTPSKEEALKISHSLISKKLIACSNIIENATSVYEWEGKINEESEAIIIAKTSSDKVNEAIEHIKSIHSYDCPCAISFKAGTSNTDFTTWVEQYVNN